MKRSEMIRRIEERLLSRFLTCSEVTRRSCAEGAEEILDLVNEEMSPPQYEGEDYTSGHAHIGLEESRDGKVLHRNWEPE
jgi:hypothetical protein